MLLDLLIIIPHPSPYLKCKFYWILIEIRDQGLLLRYEFLRIVFLYKWNIYANHDLETFNFCLNLVQINILL
jgi:hypothetical protein